ncbi:hypothetical protein TBR22_A14270 [Luteitalea sp. TBR-22]|uniref:tetratricopeptide repeat protein n=1 Tax=Luteitalea sp. TBR-22 TaxID=2802971 RepID=UPI001AF630DE|nr:hypothetical protein [Luteitalea sp. TBR-22]BCS32217.1 hypothetical protein TBR22_A14270 [Luteitalea sp. TBR-22]
MVLSALLAVPAAASPQSRTRTAEAFALAYDLQFEASHETLAQAVEADPDDPAPQRAIAAVTWMEILFAQGVATFEAFTGDIPRNDVVRPAPPPALVARFHRSLKAAAMLADRQLDRHDDADGHYQVGATAALASLYRATVEGRTMGALSQGRRAVSAMEDARAHDPRMREPALLLGMSEYTVSTLAWPLRTLAHMTGLSGDRTRALTLLREAATPGSATETDALLLLMLLEAREGRHANAVQRLRHLEQRYPRNRLLWLNHGAAALAADRPEEADDVLSRGISDRVWLAPPVVLGEAALWLAHRGTARAHLHRHADAIADLQGGLAAAPRDWVTGRIHGELGDIAAAAGESERARREFQIALTFSERSGDQIMTRRARRALDTLGR